MNSQSRGIREEPAGLPKTGSVRMRDASGGEGRPLPDLVLPSLLLFPHGLGLVSGEAYHLGKRAQAAWTSISTAPSSVPCTVRCALRPRPADDHRAGQGRFTFEVIHGTDKWVTRP